MPHQAKLRMMIPIVGGSVSLTGFAMANSHNPSTRQLGAVLILASSLLGLSLGTVLMYADLLEKHGNGVSS